MKTTIINMCKVFGFAHKIGAMASAALMFSASGDEMIKACCAMFYCTVMAIVLMIAEFKMERVKEHIVI
jgi:hypothetical protein